MMKNKYYYGFNFLWMYRKDWPVRDPDEKALDFMHSLGLNYVRIPTDYRIWTDGTDYFHPDKGPIDRLYKYFKACEKREIHFCLNLHRAPGHCINDNHLEKDNLWVDTSARDAFVFLWETFSRRFKGIPGELVSFNLLNEPPGIGQYGLTRENHKSIMKRTIESVLSIDPDRPVIIDGLNGGNCAVPECSDLPVIHSTRGYQPMALTHFKASWCEATAKVKKTIYPGITWEGKVWDESTLQEYYTPWRELERKGIQVFVGECGCYNRVANHDALQWFSDLFGLFKEWKWGYALWNFEGPFGIVNHGRPGTTYSNINGFNVDKKLLELFLKNRVVSPG